MQPYGLTVDKFLDHAAKWFHDREVVGAEAGQVRARATYAELRERSNRMSGALAALGMNQGDRVATLAWNTPHHFELYYAAMGIGLVCHTLNPRLTVAHLAAIARRARLGARGGRGRAVMLPLALRRRHLRHRIGERGLVRPRLIALARVPSPSPPPAADDAEHREGYRDTGRSTRRRAATERLGMDAGAGGLGAVAIVIALSTLLWFAYQEYQIRDLRHQIEQWETQINRDKRGSDLAIALYKTLVGSVLNVWLMANYRLLEAGSVHLVTGIIARGEDHARL